MHTLPHVSTRFHSIEALGPARLAREPAQTGFFFVGCCWGGVAALSELYEEMSVSAMDASAAATQRELAAVLSNLVLAAPELADEGAAEGGEEALEDAASARRAASPPA